MYLQRIVRAGQLEMEEHLNKSIQAIDQIQCALSTLKGEAISNRKKLEEETKME